EGAIPAIPGRATDPAGPNPTFQILYQAALTDIIDSGGDSAGVPGLNDRTAVNPFEVTLVASVTLEVTSVDPAGGTITFSVASTQAPASFFRLYYDDDTGTFADSLAGTGFTDGTLILSGSPIATPSGQGSFANALNPSPPPGQPPFVLDGYDQFGSDDYSGFQSVVGSGAARVEIRVDQASVNPGFIMSP